MQPSARRAATAGRARPAAAPFLRCVTPRARARSARAPRTDAFFAPPEAVLTRYFLFPPPPRALHLVPLPRPFPRRTWDLVSDSSCDDVIAWSPDGKSFVVKDRVALSAYLPKRAGIFKESFGGFMREMHLYGFVCVECDASGVPARFALDGFEKGAPEKLTVIRRKENFGRSRRL